MEPRIASSLLVGALSRMAEAEGGFAAVLAKGDAEAGALLLVLTQRGERVAVMERILRADGRYGWESVGKMGAANAEEAEKFLSRRRNFDPDLWILELDIPSAERFAAEMTTIG